VNASGSGWSCGESSGTVTCTRAALSPGSAPNITIHVTAPEGGGSFLSTSTVSSATDDPDTSNNDGSAETTICLSPTSRSRRPTIPIPSARAARSPTR
jgi:hypothetical protein